MVCAFVRCVQCSANCARDPRTGLVGRVFEAFGMVTFIHDIQSGFRVWGDTFIVKTSIYSTTSCCAVFLEVSIFY